MTEIITVLGTETSESTTNKNKASIFKKIFKVLLDFRVMISAEVINHNIEVAFWGLYIRIDY